MLRDVKDLNITSLSQQVTEKILSLRALQLRLVEAHECVPVHAMLSHVLHLKPFYVMVSHFQARRYLKDVIALKLPINHEITQLLQVPKPPPRRKKKHPKTASPRQCWPSAARLTRCCCCRTCSTCCPTLTWTPSSELSRCRSHPCRLLVQCVNVCLIVRVWCLGPRYQVGSESVCAPVALGPLLSALQTNDMMLVTYVSSVVRHQAPQRCFANGFSVLNR